MRHTSDTKITLPPMEQLQAYQARKLSLCQQQSEKISIYEVQLGDVNLPVPISSTQRHVGVDCQGERPDHIEQLTLANKILQNALQRFQQAPVWPGVSPMNHATTPQGPYYLNLDTPGFPASATIPYNRYSYSSGRALPDSGYLELSTSDKSHAPQISHAIQHQQHVPLEDQIDKSKKRIKKDMLWKPLFRGFRQFFRQRMSVFFDIKAVIENPHKPDVEDHLRELCQEFLVYEKAPQYLVDDPLTWKSMIVLSMPVAAKNMKEAIQFLPSVHANLNPLLQTFCATFRENSIRLRIKFFKNKLIQFMWAKYIESEALSIYRYIESLMSSEDRHEEGTVLIREIIELSNRVDFQILRPELLQVTAATDLQWHSSSTANNFQLFQ